MINFVFHIYRVFFARKIFYKFNKLLYQLSIRGMGIFNFESDKLSGEANFIASEVPCIQGGIILDVGANVGNYAIKLRASNSAAQIYCFEPHPITFQKLLRNSKESNLKLFNVGVGSTKGKLKLYDYVDEDGSSHASLYKDVIEKIHKRESIEHEVDVITLDDFVEKNGINRVHLLKIDTEGHELSVLKGFERHIQSGRVDIIHFEFNEMNVASKVFFKDFWDLLPNYHFFRMLPDGLVSIDNYCPLACEIFAYQNIVAKLKVPAVS